MKKALRIMFAGGCHVLGYPVGMEYGFPQVALQALNEEYACEARSLGYLSFARKDRLLGAFREFAPDVIVLQLGHYECPRPLEKILRKSRLGMLLRSPSAATSSSSSSSRSSGSSDLVHGPNPGMSFHSTWQWRARSCTRLVAGATFEWAGQPVYNWKKVSADLSALLEAIREHSDCRTVLLSPFLCPDYMIRVYRRRAWKIFKDAARKHDCLFVDSQRLLLQLESSRSDLNLYADADHLSVKGHEIVGLHLVEQIRDLLPQAALRAGTERASLSLP